MCPGSLGSLYLPRKNLLRGKYSDPNDPGHIPHSQALSTALSGTLGLGNIAGVAIAISIGGPGAVFWMWVTAIVGVATKFYTASLAVMYRGKDSSGILIPSSTHNVKADKSFLASQI